MLRRGCCQSNSCFSLEPSTINVFKIKHTNNIWENALSFHNKKSVAHFRQCHNDTRKSYWELHTPDLLIMDHIKFPVGQCKKDLYISTVVKRLNNCCVLFIVYFGNAHIHKVIRICWSCCCIKIYGYGLWKKQFKCLSKLLLSIQVLYHTQRHSTWVFP